MVCDIDCAYPGHSHSWCDCVIRLSVLCWSLVWCVLFCVLSSFAIILTRERERETDRERDRERAGCLAFIVIPMFCYCKCCVAIPHGAVGWSTVCNCGIS